MLPTQHCAMIYRWYYKLSHFIIFRVCKAQWCKAEPRAHLSYVDCGQASYALSLAIDEALLLTISAYCRSIYCPIATSSNRSRSSSDSMAHDTNITHIPVREQLLQSCHTRRPCRWRSPRLQATTSSPPTKMEDRSGEGGE